MLIPSAGGRVSGRAWAVIKIHAKEFHRHPIEHSVEVYDRGWTKSFDRLVGFGDYHAGQLARFVLGRGPMPLLATMRVREQLWQFWRPMNKLDVLGIDWMRLAPLILVVLGFAAILPLRASASSFGSGQVRPSSCSGGAGRRCSAPVSRVPSLDDCTASTHGRWSSPDLAAMLRRCAHACWS